MGRENGPGGGPGTANEIKHALQFDKTVFGICYAPDSEAPSPRDRPLAGRYVRLGAAAEVVSRVLDLLGHPG